ncbi:conserved hypothetical protein [Paraglaciecola sp. T6c]|uniref:hypothetical protein n=1 Tax=Pseudoalteromonas atlantica (strain T6c / ATCC BAA-1087) TaxID=3042615 RepID=UPI00005C5973|nr:hypothetical protein [Paraglaciecola sp. T6c]ABG41089.1 conserved hypothetical protein [Paraglaciecola sp. T6c]
MKPIFDIQPSLGTTKIPLDAPREQVLNTLNQPFKSINKYPERKLASDAFYRNDLHVSYQGDPAAVESIEFAYSELYDVTLLGESILSLPVKSALAKIEALTGHSPVTHDNGYTYEIPELGLWLWRESNDNFDENGFYFFTIGIKAVR